MTAVPDTAVSIVPSLSQAALEQVVSGQVCVLLVRTFCDPQLCQKLTAQLLKSRPEHYTHEVYDHGHLKEEYLGVDRIGFPFNATFGGNAKASDIYYRSALPGIRHVRNACEPFLSPIDRLRLELDELWPDGATVAAFEGRKMFVGIVRVMQAATSTLSEEHPHFDALPERYRTFDAQLAANIFLAVPESGGEFETWNAPPLHAGVESLSTDPDPRKHLGQGILVTPQTGDLVIFNAGRPHATRQFTSGSRISLQCFMGYARSHPLMLWN